MARRIIRLYLNNTFENKNLTAKGVIRFYIEERWFIYIYTINAVNIEFLSSEKKTVLHITLGYRRVAVSKREGCGGEVDFNLSYCTLEGTWGRAKNISRATETDPDTCIGKAYWKLQAKLRFQIVSRILVYKKKKTGLIALLDIIFLSLL